MLHNGEELEVSTVNTDSKELCVSSPVTKFLVTVSLIIISFKLLYVPTLTFSRPQTVKLMVVRGVD